jgi:putative two-component system response regulator
LAKLAEHRDPETGAHLERVQEYCRLLAEYLATKPTYRHQIDRRFIDALVRSSPLHDIGKVGIPDRILLKPDRLTPDEYEIMKTHARIGGDILQSLIDQHQGQTFLEMGRDIAYYHHEKFDGSGYPFGMSGRDIPLPARILAVADVYDALTSKRVYKSAMDHNSAKTLVDEGIGRHFDPEIIEAFHAQESAFCETCVRLADDATEHDYPFVFDGEVADSIMS